MMTKYEDAPDILEISGEVGEHCEDYIERIEALSHEIEEDILKELVSYASLSPSEEDIDAAVTLLKRQVRLEGLINAYASILLDFLSTHYPIMYDVPYSIDSTKPLMLVKIQENDTFLQMDQALNIAQRKKARMMLQEIGAVK